MSGFDLGAARPVIEREDAGQVVHIRDEAGEPMYVTDDEPVTVTVAGTYSKRYRAALQQRYDRLTKRGSKRPDTDDMDADARRLVAECVLSWAGVFEDGTPLDCTVANVVKVLEIAPWVREQIEHAMDDHAGFSRGSSRA